MAPARVSEQFARKLSEGGVDQFDIKAEVQRQGFSLTGIAKAAGLYESACRQGIIGNSRAGAEALAEALGVPFRKLFPTLYVRGRHSEGQPSRTLAHGDSAKTAANVDRERRSA